MALSLITLAACLDLPTHPSQGTTLDPAGVAYVMPAVIDARVRVAAGIKDPVVRGQVVDGIASLERALAAGDGGSARYFMADLAAVISDYGIVAPEVDGADLTAITLMLQAVARMMAAGGPGE